MRSPGQCAGLVWAAIVLAACATTVHSSNVKTVGIFPTYTVETTTGASPVARATFQVQDAQGAFLELVDGDEVAADGLALALTPAMTPDTAVEYSAQLTSSAKHSFVFTRSGEAPISEDIDEPPPFQVTNAPFDVSYDAQLTLTWTPPLVGATVTLTARGAASSCPDHTLADHHADTGSFAFSGSDFKPGDKTSPDCNYVLEVARESSHAIVASPFGGGALVSKHVESTTLHIH